MPSLPELRRHRARERVDARLRRRVRRGARGHQLPADRRDVHDAAAVALRDEVPAERAAHVEGAVEVHVDHGAPLLDGQVDHRDPVVAARRAGVVHDDVDAPELVEHLRRASVSTASGSDTSLTTARARRPSARTSSATESMSRHPACCSSSG